MEKPNYYFQIAEILKENRQKKNMTKTELSKGICSVSYISRIENGERCPTSVILRQIANKLGISTEQLFRSIESPSATQIQQILHHSMIYIERWDVENLYKLINEELNNINITSIHDLQLIKGLKCFSSTLLNRTYKTGVKEIKSILELTYTKGNIPRDIEFALMGLYGFFLLLDGQKKDAFEHLIEMIKYVDSVEFLYTLSILPHYYIVLIMAYIENSKIPESLLYIDLAINYCKKHNALTNLRELFLLKGEVYHYLNNEDEFKYWYDKAMTLHNIIKTSDKEYFDTFVENRLSKLKTSQ